MRKMVDRNCTLWLQYGGFSLVELLVVIAIIAIGLSIATLNFRSWTVKTNIDKQTKELFGDISEARLRSQYRKQYNSILIENSSTYSFKSYSTENEPAAAGRKVFTKTISYQITSPGSDTNIRFNTRGSLYTGIGTTIYFGPSGTGAFDCVVIDDVRTNMGKTTNGSCVQQ